MGEFEKSVGEHGEKIVDLLLRRVGWANNSANFDIPCSSKTKHALGKSSERVSHGIDFSFGYKSPLFSRRYDAVVVSSKFSTIGYPKTPTKKFKEYFIHLDQTIDCLKKSEDFARMKGGIRGVDSSTVRGVVFAINNKNNPLCILEAFQDSRMQALNNLIGLVENKRFQFLWDSLNRADRFDHRSLNKWSFAYHPTGHNIESNSISGEGQILPFELMIGGPIVFRIHHISSESKSMLICSPERFSEPSLLSMMDLAMEHSGRGWASAVHICFQNYSAIESRPIVERAKGNYSDQLFARAVTVSALSSSPLQS